MQAVKPCTDTCIAIQGWGYSTSRDPNGSVFEHNFYTTPGTEWFEHFGALNPGVTLSLLLLREGTVGGELNLFTITFPFRSRESGC